MRHKLSLFALLLLIIGTLAEAQDLRVTCQPDQASLLFGEPVYATYRVENISKRTIYVCAYKDKGGNANFIGWKAEAFGPIGKVPYNWQSFGSKPRLPLLPGESIQAHQPLPITDTRVDQLPTGAYSLIFEVSYSLLAEASSWELKARCESSFQVIEPDGQDREWIQALKNAVQTIQADTTRVRPALRWGEVLDGSLEHQGKPLCSSFPTSTYAGYPLARKVYDYSSPLYKPVPATEQVRMSRDEGKTILAFPQQEFESYFKQLDCFMQGGNTPQSLSTELWSFYGDLLVQRGRFAEAEKAFKKAIASPAQSPKADAYFKRAQEFLAALEKKS